MALRKSTKIAIGFALLTGGGYLAYDQVTDYLALSAKFTPIKPGNVNLLGIDTGTGYRIIVANQIAQLVEADSEFEGDRNEDTGATSGAIKKRVPMRELLQVLQGNEKAVGAFVMNMNDIREDETWPTTRVVWTAEDIRRALDGDAALRARLERDLNMYLDGRPLPTANISALNNGIIVDTPVTLNIQSEGKDVHITGRIQEPYRPRMILAVENLVTERAGMTADQQVGFYLEEGRKALNEPNGRENIAKTLENRISPSVAASRAEKPERVLRRATVVVNDQFIRGARYDSLKDSDGKPYYNLVIQFNEEGRRRLWQFSKKRVGSQLLLTVDGIPIAAPRIRHDLAQGELTITQLRDESLVQDAVNALNNRAQESAPQA
jgi:hypothetical protein